MALLLTIVLALATFMIGIVGNLVASELFEWMPKWAERLVRSAAARVNEQERERCLEEWLRSLEDTPGGLKKLWDALTLRLWGAAEVNQNDAAPRQLGWVALTLILYENLLIISAFYAGVYIHLGQDFLELVGTDGALLLRFLLISYVFQLYLYYADLYDNPRLPVNNRKLLIRIFYALCATTLSLTALSYCFWPGFGYRASVIPVFATSAVLAVVSVIGWRLGFGWMIRRLGPPSASA